MYCRAAFGNYAEYTIERTWEDNTPVETIIRDVARAFVLTPQLLGDFSKLGNIKRNKTFSTDVKSAMNQLADQYGLRWALQEDRITIVCEGDFTNANPKTGSMRTIGPDRLLMNQTQVSAKSEQYVTVDIAVKLDATLSPFDQIKIQTDNAILSLSNAYFLTVQSKIDDGIYEITSVNHTGDFYGDDWTTIAFCKPPLARA